jgi:hypothetical protein
MTVLALVGVKYGSIKYYVYMSLKKLKYASINWS